jgi:adenylate kinase
MKIILLGPPGAGKGTLASSLVQQLNVPTISTGNILRNAMKDGTPLGRLAENYINDGKFVPDDVVESLVQEEIQKKECKNGFILDGFPRNLSQAEALETVCDVDAVLLMEVPDEEIKERMTGRRVCDNCGATFHVHHNPPKAKGVCDVCGESLSIREDDKPEIVGDRLKTYHRQTEPLIRFYEEKKLLQRLNAACSIPEAARRAFDILGIERL